MKRTLNYGSSGFPVEDRDLGVLVGGRPLIPRGFTRAIPEELKLFAEEIANRKIKTC
jgi:hypothetical protein